MPQAGKGKDGKDNKGWDESLRVGGSLLPPMNGSLLPPMNGSLLPPNEVR